MAELSNVVPRKIWNKVIEWYDGNNTEDNVSFRTKVIRGVVDSIDGIKKVIDWNKDIMRNLQREEMFILWSLSMGIPTMIVKTLFYVGIAMTMGIFIATAVRKQGYYLVMYERVGWKYVRKFELRERSN